MIPIHFGSEDRTLFGVYTPAGRPRRRRGIVLCNPWGMEALRAHRSLKVLADVLAESGYDVLRFDYFGTGDSFGDGADVTRHGCVEDTVHAVEELSDAARVRRVSLAGLRFGAHVAADAFTSLHGHRRDRLVAWDPITDAEDHLARLVEGATVNAHGERTVGGFPLPNTLQEDLRRLSLGPFGSASDRVLIVHSGDPGPRSRQGRKGGFEVVLEASPRCWSAAPGLGIGPMPEKMLSMIRTWMR